MDCLSLWSKYVHRVESEVFLANLCYSTHTLYVMVAHVVIVCADKTLSLAVAELGRDALSVQAAPHDPGAGLQ